MENEGRAANIDSAGQEVCGCKGRALQRSVSLARHGCVNASLSEKWGANGRSMSLQAMAKVCMRSGLETSTRPVARACCVEKGGREEKGREGDHSERGYSVTHKA